MREASSHKEKAELTLRKKKITKIVYRVMMAATFAAMLTSIVLFVLEDNKPHQKIFNELSMCVLALFCLSIPIFLEKKFKVFIPNYILITLYIFIFSHFVLGEVYRVYDSSNFFDKILHTISGMIIAMLSFSIVSILNELPKSKTKLSPFFVAIFAFCFTMTLEYLWELFEYAMDSLFGFNMQRWQDSLVDQANIPGALDQGEFLHSDPRGSGLKDTMADMFVNIFGALAVCIYGYINMKLKSSDWILNKVILTDGDISALKKTKPEMEVKRETDAPKRLRPLPLRLFKFNGHFIIGRQAARKTAATKRKSKQAKLHKGILRDASETSENAEKKQQQT